MQKIKNIIRSIWNEFVYGGHLLSLGAVSIVFTSAILLKIEITWDFLVVVYLSVHAAYLYNRYKDFKKDYLTNPERTRYLEKKIKMMPSIIFCFLFIFIIILLFFSGISALFFGLFISSLSLLYSKLFKNLTKNIVGFKNFFVSIVWALLVIFLVIYYSYPLNISVILLFLFIFLRWIINTSFFDIKDIESDKKESLLTLAIFLGKRKMVSILSVVNILSVIPIILGIYLNLFPVYSLVLIFVIPYSTYYFKKEKNRNVNKSFLYNVIVDGEFILWSFVILLTKFLI